MCGIISSMVSASQRPPPTAPAPARRIEDTATRARPGTSLWWSPASDALPSASGRWRCSPSVTDPSLPHAGVHYLCADAAGGRPRAADAGDSVRARLGGSRSDDDTPDDQGQFVVHVIEDDDVHVDAPQTCHRGRQWKALAH